MSATPLPPKVERVSIYRGDTWEFPQYQFLDASGEPENLTGYTWSAQWRSSPDATDPLALTVDATGAATGLITVTASAAITAQMAATGVWDLQSTLAGVVKTWCRGAVSCTKDATRAS